MQMRRIITHLPKTVRAESKKKQQNQREMTLRAERRQNLLHLVTAVE